MRQVEVDSNEGGENQIGARIEVYVLGGTCRPFDEQHAQVSLRTQAELIWV